MKALTRTGSGVLALADAPISSLALIGRAARPYPPGNVTVRVTNPENVLNPPDTVEITWARRNRITQADLLVDWKAADIAPEVGATCRIRLYGRVGGAEKLIHEAAGLSGTAYTHQFDPAPLASLGFPPLGALDAIRVTIASERDSLASWQTVEITLRRQGLFFVR